VTVQLTAIYGSPPLGKLPPQLVIFIAQELGIMQEYQPIWGSICHPLEEYV